jgi:hypothetical protein
MRFLSLDTLGKSSQFHDERALRTAGNNFVGMPTAILVEAYQKVAFRIFAILCLASGFAQSGEIIKFDAPGAGNTGFLQGTFPLDINAFGQAIGYFIDAQHLFHGFVRYADGRIETIDAPGAGTNPAFISEGTIAYSINIEGTIVGRYLDSQDVYHGFLREPGGHFITFDAPAAGTGFSQGTVADDINSEGTILGNVYDSNGVSHGFLRSPSGAFTLFDVPKATLIPASGSGLNAFGVSTGSYYSGTNFGTGHGYVRQSGGRITSFDPTGSTNTVPASINLEGTIVGTFSDAGFANHGFIRSANGTITTFDVPGSFNYTSAVGITPFGIITGSWADLQGSHGFVRYPNGAFSKFDVPGPPQAINFWGEIVGQFTDSDGSHGFIRLP